MEGEMNNLKKEKKQKNSKTKSYYSCIVTLQCSGVSSRSQDFTTVHAVVFHCMQNDSFTHWITTHNVCVFSERNLLSNLRGDLLSFTVRFISIFVWKQADLSLYNIFASFDIQRLFFPSGRRCVFCKRIRPFLQLRKQLLLLRRTP